MNMMRDRMGVQDRFENDPQFGALVNMLTAWLMAHPDYTPTELREAAMSAAMRAEMMTLDREFRFARDGTLIERRHQP